MIKLKLFIFIINILNKIYFSCLLNGNITGKCVSKKSLENEITFCDNFISDFICVPYFNNIWYKWTNKSIDEFLEKKLVNIIEKEFLKEISLGTFKMPLINKIGCLDAYLQFICKKNFPYCNYENDTSYSICKSTCDNFVSKCDTYNGDLCKDYPTNNCKK